MSTINQPIESEAKIWETQRVPNGFWKKNENVREALTWLFEEKLQWTNDDIKEKLTRKVMLKHNLQGMLKSAFDSSLYNVANYYSDGEIQPWELSCTPRGYFDDERNQIKAVKWLFEKKLKIKKPSLYKPTYNKKINIDVFLDNGLGSLLLRYDSYHEVLKFVYPNDLFNEWEMMERVPLKFWDDKENRLRALRWLFYELKQWNDEQIVSQINTNLFQTNHLSGLFQVAYNESPYKALKDFFECKKKPWETSEVSHAFWKSEQTCIFALEWLLEEKCINTPLTEQSFIDNGLYDFFITKYNGSIKEAINHSHQVNAAKSK